MLIIARNYEGGIVEYQSRVTGRRYFITPYPGGFVFSGPNINVTGTHKEALLSLLEKVDGIV